MNCPEVCVVMATYNGSKYIIEQLDSLRLQTLQPNTVCIIDDCSQDNTLQIIQKYISDYNLSSWQLSVHKENKGYISTFWEAIFATNEKYIFLCDQDDIWYTDKIERMYEKIRKHPECLLLCSDFEFLYENGSVKTNKFEIKGKIIDGIKKIKQRSSINVVKRPGCTYCVDRVLVNYYDKYHLSIEPHDTFFYYIALLLDQLYLLPEVTIKWRRHLNNASNRPTSSYIQRVIKKEKDSIVYERNFRFYKNEINKNLYLIIQLFRRDRAGKYKAEYFRTPSILKWIKCIPFINSVKEFANMWAALHWLSKLNRERNQ